MLASDANGPYSSSSSVNLDKTLLEHLVKELIVKPKVVLKGKCVILEVSSLV